MSQFAQAILALIALSVDKILAQVPNLADAELAELIAAEKAQKDGGRKTLIEALELKQMEREEEAKKKAAVEAEEAAKAKAAEDAAEAQRLSDEAAAAAKDAEAKAANDAAEFPVTDFRHPDYNGPLHGAQAEWRNAHLKRGG